MAAQDMLEQIQNLPEKHRGRVMGEYIKMRLNQRQRRGWGWVYMEIHDRYIRKLQVARVKLGNQYLYYTVPLSSGVNLPSVTVYFFSASLIASTT